jgi:hypothetical protein
MGCRKGLSSPHGFSPKPQTMLHRILRRRQIKEEHRSLSPPCKVLKPEPQTMKQVAKGTGVGKGKHTVYVVESSWPDGGAGGIGGIRQVVSPTLSRTFGDGHAVQTRVSSQTKSLALPIVFSVCYFVLRLNYCTCRHLPRNH